MKGGKGDEVVQRPDEIMDFVLRIHREGVVSAYLSEISWY
jgi:hypothetical protein